VAKSGVLFNRRKKWLTIAEKRGFARSAKSSGRAHATKEIRFFARIVKAPKSNAFRIANAMIASAIPASPNPAAVVRAVAAPVAAAKNRKGERMTYRPRDKDGSLRKGKREPEAASSPRKTKRFKCMNQPHCDWEAESFDSWQPDECPDCGSTNIVCIDDGKKKR
jgi:hypothetical protein